MKTKQSKANWRRWAKEQAKKEQERKQTLPAHCDTCGREISQYQYKRGQGLCVVCVDMIQ